MDYVTKKNIERFSQAVAAMDRALALHGLPDDVERDAVVLRFELAAELMPKTLRRVLREHGESIRLPKDIVRATSAADIIDANTAETLIRIIDDRNRMVHDYNEDYAESLLKRIREEYAAALKSVADALSKSE